MSESLEMAKAALRYEASKALYDISGEAYPFTQTLRVLPYLRRRAVRASLNNLTLADLATVAHAYGVEISIGVEELENTSPRLSVPWWA